MFTNTPFEAIAKSFADAAPHFNPVALQDAIKPAQENLKAWANLAQRQAQEAQAFFAKTAESMKNVKDPQAALEAFKDSSDANVVLVAKNLKEAIALSVDQFHAAIDAIEKSHPAPDAFAAFAKNLKAAASTAESTLIEALEKVSTFGATIASTAKAKRKS